MSELGDGLKYGLSFKLASKPQQESDIRIPSTSRLARAGTCARMTNPSLERGPATAGALAREARVLILHLAGQGTGRCGSAWLEPWVSPQPRSGLIMHRSLPALFCLAALLHACASTTPYAEIDGNPIHGADMEQSPVLIAGAGAQMKMRPQAKATLEVGKQLVELRTLRNDRGIRSKLATLALDARPCMRYFVVARHPVGANPNDWYVEIVKTEPIPECTPTAAASK